MQRYDAKNHCEILDSVPVLTKVVRFFCRRGLVVFLGERLQPTPAGSPFLLNREAGQKAPFHGTFWRNADEVWSIILAEHDKSY